MSTEILVRLTRDTISWLEKAAFQVMFISIKYLIDGPGGVRGCHL